MIPGIPGGPEILIIAVLAIMLFLAPKALPKLARSAARAPVEAKKAYSEAEAELIDESPEGGE